MIQSIRSLLVLLFGAIAVCSSDLAAQTWRKYSLSAGTATAPLSGSPTATNLQVTPGVGTVTVTITWGDGNTTTHTASPTNPLNISRYDQEHQAYTIRSFVIAYNQPAGTHPADGRWKLQ